MSISYMNKIKEKKNICCSLFTYIKNIQTDTNNKKFKIQINFEVIYKKIKNQMEVLILINVYYYFGRLNSS